MKRLASSSGLAVGLVLGLLLAPIACGSAQGPAPTPPTGPVASSSSVEPSTSAAPSASTAAASSASTTSAAPTASTRMVLFEAGGTLHRAAPDGSGEGATAIRFDGNTGGATGIGAGAPLLSHDLRWIAFLRGDDLWVARTDGSATRQITDYNKPGGKTGATVYISGFSPDDAQLVFHIGAIQCEDDCLSLPAAVTAGFESLALPSFARTRLPKVEGFDAFRADGKAVLFAKYLAQSSYELREFALADGASRVVRTSKAPYGFSQLVAEGGLLSFVDRDAVVVGPVDGATTAPLTRKGAFAEYQRPRFAPGGAHVAYEHRDKTNTNAAIEVVPSTTSAQLATPKRVCDKCQAEWWDATHLVVSDAAGVRLVALDGGAVALAKTGAPIAVGTH